MYRDIYTSKYLVTIRSWLRRAQLTQGHRILTLTKLISHTPIALLMLHVTLNQKILILVGRKLLHAPFNTLTHLSVAAIYLSDDRRNPRRPVGKTIHDAKITLKSQHNNEQGALRLLTHQWKSKAKENEILRD